MFDVIGQAVLSAVDLDNKLVFFDKEVCMIISELFLPFDCKRQPPQKIIVYVFFFGSHFPA